MSLMVGVSGIRGIVGETLTPELAARAGSAMATFTRGGRVVVGRDSRPSGEMVKAGVVAGLLAGGCEVVDLGIVSTPSVGVMVNQLNAAGGIELTASHNPEVWNGIKFITADGCAPPKSVAQEIIRIFEERAFTLKPYDLIGAYSVNTGAETHHVETVLQLVDANAIREKGFRVVLDSVNGAGGPAGKALLTALGCDVVHMNAEPTGIFGHTPEPIEQNLQDLCAAVKESKADVGFAQDPDADRLAIVSGSGTYIGEEFTLALAARHMFRTRPGAVVVNLSTSRMVDDLARQAGGDCKVLRSAVGEANVVEVMRANNAVLGGEGNGGVIDPRVVYIRDSLTAMAFTLQLLVDEARTLDEIVADMPSYSMIKDKFPCDKPRIAAALAAVEKKFSDANLNTEDGVRIDWPEGWVHVRGSNTEPIMRIIAEAENEAAARDLIDRVEKVVNSTT